MAKQTNFEPFVIDPQDPLAQEHQALQAWEKSASEKLGETRSWIKLNPKETPEGELLLKGDAEQSRRYVMAALAQIRHWDQLVSKIQRLVVEAGDRAGAALKRDLKRAQASQNSTHDVLNVLLRRKLPYTADDLLDLLKWLVNEGEEKYQYNRSPLGQISNSLERLASEDPEFLASLKPYVSELKICWTKGADKLARLIERLLDENHLNEKETSDSVIEPSPMPAPCGMPGVLTEFKRRLNMLPVESSGEVILLAPDQFAMPVDSALRKEHELLSDCFREFNEAFDKRADRILEYQHFQDLDAWALGRISVAAADRLISGLLSRKMEPDQSQEYWVSRHASSSMLGQLMAENLSYESAGAFDLILCHSLLPFYFKFVISGAADALIAYAQENSLDEGERFVFSLYRESRIKSPPLGVYSEEVKALTRVIRDGAEFYLVPGEVWTNTLNSDIFGMDHAQKTAWLAVLSHALSATSSRPSSKWLKTAEQHLQAVDSEQMTQMFLRWFPLVLQGTSPRRTVSQLVSDHENRESIHPENADCLRGLLWFVPLLAEKETLIRHVTSLALSAYKKIPGVGPRAVKVGNAAVYTLSELSSEAAVGQLALLKVRVKFGTAQKEIEKAFDASANALGLPRDQIEELGVPAYGLEEVGHTSTELGDYRAELQIIGSNAKLCWFDVNHKSLKSVPAKVKSEFKEELKELQQSLKDIQAMLPAQKDRIDSLFLLQKSWPISQWSERYLEHPLVGTIARRVVWCVDGTPVIFHDGTLKDVDGIPVNYGKTAEITLWHPVERSVEEIISWRRRLEEWNITQPFKQVYREVYLLTDAEQNTHRYSNRYAAHIIRQHQFHALCAARGWKNKLRLFVDDSYPPATKELPNWGLRAEFWIEGIGDNYPVDANEAGAYLRLATDQVRFYRSTAAINYAHASGGGYQSAARGPGLNDVNEPVPLGEIPPLVFSEVMRDVDLFVGVASVGNDPTWQDGGPEGRYRDYWQNYSFGKLTETASTRKQVLERLIPRMKIATRCSFSERFLVVRGDMRTYKIHMGSGNILMEPNDQYLCIVPDSRARAAQDNFYLPFEGDNTLSIIISKALLLADDTKIKDPSITRQLKLSN